MDKIFVKGARENNLKNIDLEIPRDKLVVFTGLSGSGKSSLAFDTILPRGKEDTSRVCQATQECFWDKCKTRRGLYRGTFPRGVD